MLTSLPNLLTVSRIVAIPVILLFMAFPHEAWAAWTALTLYVLACVTDYFDGYFARAWKEESMIGKFLDPIADKLLVGALLIMLAGTHRLPLWALPAGIIILMREILVSGLREFLAGLKHISVPVSRLAKWKTAIQMIALGILIIGVHGPWWDQFWLTLGALGLWAAAIITVITGWDYLQTGLKHMMDPEIIPPGEAL